MSTPEVPSPRLDLRSGPQRVFAHLLVSNAIVSVVNYTVRFAVTFWVFLATRSVFATGTIAGIFVVATAATGIWFGSLVDHHRKRSVLQASALVSVAVYGVCLAVYLATPDGTFSDVASWQLWAFVVLCVLGVVAGNPRGIALPTLVTLLVPAEVRDRANGLVGTVTGTSMLVTSVISGVLVASGGMLHVLLLAIVVITASVLHLARVEVPEDRTVDAGASGAGAGVDLRGTWRLVRGVPGLVPLIAFSCFNNFIGGGFMALMDAYGLSLVSVQVWGLLWGGLSALMIVGGLLVARLGLGSRPVRLLLLVNLVSWTVTMLFPLASSIVTLTLAMVVFMLLMPFAEAAEQTVLQRVVPYERQGRVFGFAAERRAVRRSRHGVPRRSDHPVPRRPVHDRRRGGGGDRRLVRNRADPGDRSGLRGHRAAGSGRDGGGPPQPAVPRTGGVLLGGQPGAAIHGRTDVSRVTALRSAAVRPTGAGPRPAPAGRSATSATRAAPAAQRGRGRTPRTRPGRSSTPRDRRRG